MKIQSNPNIQKIMKAYGKQAPKAKKTEGVKFEEDKIEISTQAKEIQVAMQAIKDTPEIREEKVNAIRAQIKDGTYKPSSEDVANKILGRLTGDEV
jgi:negative regulator of flagellin synthesis FlgM